jgi:16S rRNA (uracil1498-N3)-methyltransferase
MVRHVPRLYVGSYSLSDNHTITLADHQHHYLCHVLRVQPGSKVLVFNAADGEWECAVESVSKTIVRLSVLYQRLHPQKLSETHLYFSPLRKERLMDVMEKGTELGVTHFHPVLTDHTAHAKINLEKLEIYIQDAAEQCGRCDMPQLDSPKNIIDVLSSWSQDIPLFLALEGEVLPPLCLAQSKDSMHIAVGPEGGWSEAEKQQFHTLPFVKPFSLGSLTLRAETAVISSLSILNYLRTQATPAGD